MHYKDENFLIQFNSTHITNILYFLLLPISSTYFILISSTKCKYLLTQKIP